MLTTRNDSARRAAHDMHAVLDTFHGDPSQDRSTVEAALAPLIGHHDELFDSGLVRPNSFMRWSRVAYYDANLTFILSSDDAGFRENAHNHGIWNVLLVSSGSMHFRWYRRLDDQSVHGHAQLELVDDRVLRAGDVGIVAPPPHDIHEFEILEEDTWIFTAAPGPANRIRQMYDVASGTYVEKALFGAPLPSMS